MVELCVSSAKRLWVQFPGNTHTDKKMYSLMHCKSLWIKASAKCINVNVKPDWKNRLVFFFGQRGDFPLNMREICVGHFPAQYKFILKLLYLAYEILQSNSCNYDPTFMLYIICRGPSEFGDVPHQF